MKTKHPQPSPTLARVIRHSTFVIRHSSASLLLLLPVLATAEETGAGATLTPEQQKAIASARAGEIPKMPSWMRGSETAPAAPTLDPNQVELIKAEMARQKEQADQFSKTHDRLHGGKNKERGKSEKTSSADTSKDPTGKTSNAGDFVENYLTVTGIIDRDEKGGQTDEQKAKEEAEKISRNLEAQITGISQALLGGGASDPLSALADRLGGIAVAPPAPTLSGASVTAGRNPYLGATGGGSYGMGANGSLVTRGQSANPYLSAGAASASRPAPVFTAPVTSSLAAPALSTPPPPPPPPAPTALERDRQEEARQKRFFPNKDNF